MGVGRRLIDLARANLNALLDRAATGELDGASDEQLRAELQRRASERSAQELERQKRLAVEAAARSRGQKRAPSARTRGAARRASAADARAAKIAKHERTLGVRAGAPWDEVKRAYRALMREHHPDKHAGDPRRQQLASEKSALITSAYAELELLIQKR